jgi:MSHA pilin protein MshD
MSTRAAQCRQHGLTLIELIIFIVVVGVAVVGVLLALQVTVRSSADPVIRKNMLAIAEALLEEVQLQPFTYCDPDDANAATAQSAVVGASGCSTTVEAFGPETMGGATEVRTSNTVPFDNVNDYHALTLGGAASSVTSLTGAALAPVGYSASIAVTSDSAAGSALGPAGLQVPAAALLRITVTVARGSESLVLEGYRTRYAPNSLP